MYRIAIRTRFSAAHKLPGHPGKCSGLHGHTWVVEVVVASPETGEDGMVVDFGWLKKLVKEAISPYDHGYLNETAPFDQVPPTAENLARSIYETVSPSVSSFRPSARIDSVTVWESEDAYAKWAPGGV